MTADSFPDTPAYSALLANPKVPAQDLREAAAVLAWDRDVNMPKAGRGRVDPFEGVAASRGATSERFEHAWRELSERAPSNNTSDGELFIIGRLAFLWLRSGRWTYSSHEAKEAS